MLLGHRASQELGKGGRVTGPSVKGEAGQLGVSAGRLAGQECSRSADTVGESVLAHFLDHSICSREPPSER